MAKPEEWHGLWWLPENPVNKVPGWLRPGADGRLTLELSGAFLDSARLLGGDRRPSTRIVGQLETMPVATLEGCLLRNHAGVFVSPRETWHVGEAIIGAQFSADEPWQFHGAAFSIPGLTLWASPAVVEQNCSTKSERPTKFSIAAAADSLPLWSWSGTRVSIGRSLSTGTLGEYVGTLSAERQAWMHSSQAFSRKELFDHVVAPLQVLIALATGEFTAAVSGRAYLQSFQSGGRNESSQWRWCPHDISLKPESARYGFHYGDVHALGAGVWDRWLAFWKGREAVRDLYLGAIRQSGFAELSFLMAAQALESFHRLGTPLTIMEAGAWTKTKTAIKTILTEAGAPQVIVDRLRHLNEPTLRTRLEDLGARLEPLLGALVGDDPVEFFRRITKTRDYYTHWDGDGGIYKQGEETYYALERLLAMLEVLLLRELGFDWASPAILEVMRRRVEWLPKTS